MENETLPMIGEFVLYNNWANGEILAACEKLDAAQLEASAPGTYGTIRDTLRHIIRGEALYLYRLTGKRLEPPFRWEDKPDLTAVRGYADRVGQALLETVSTTNPTQLVIEQEDGETFQYTALVLFIQIINHGIEHRTNITTILEQLSVKPPGVDGWNYMETHAVKFQFKQGKVE